MQTFAPLFDPDLVEKAIADGKVKSTPPLEMQLKLLTQCREVLLDGKLTGHKHVGTVIQQSEKSKVGNKKVELWWLGYILCYTPTTSKGNMFTVLYQSNESAQLTEDDLDRWLGIEDEADCNVCHKDRDESFVQCSACRLWWHLVCHIPQVTVKDLQAENWYCHTCKALRDTGLDDADSDGEEGRGFPGSQLATID